MVVLNVNTPFVNILFTLSYPWTIVVTFVKFIFDVLDPPHVSVYEIIGSL